MYKYILENLFEFDEVECVMASSGISLVDEDTINIDPDIEDVEDDDSDDYYDETIESIGATFTVEDEIVNDYREARDCCMISIRDDIVDSFMMGIDPDVEDVEDDDMED